MYETKLVCSGASRRPRVDTQSASTFQCLTMVVQKQTGKQAAADRKPGVRLARLAAWVALAAVMSTRAARAAEKPTGFSDATRAIATAPLSGVPAAEVTPLSSTSQVEQAATDPAFALKLRTIEELEQDGQFTEAIRLSKTLKESSKEAWQLEALSTLMARLLDEKTESAELQQAVRYLSSNNPGYIPVALEKLLQAGETGRILLRKAVREEADGAALIAVQALIEQNDSKTLSLFLEQLIKRRSASILKLMAADLKKRVHAIPINGLAMLHQVILTDTNFAHREAGDVLVTVFEKRCERAAEPYNQLVNAADGHEALRAYVERALLSRDTQTIAWACRQGGSLAGSFHGAIGRYYADTGFSQLAAEQTDFSIYLPNRQFPLPDGRFNNVSAQWSADLEIPKAGEYTFYVVAKTRCVVSIYTQAVVECQGDTEASGKIRLPAGRVPFRADYTCMNSQHSSGVQVFWSGPDIPKQTVGSAFLRTPARPEAVFALRPAILNLVSTNRNAVTAAKAILSESGETGDIVLRDALRNEPDPVAASAAEWLAARRDRRSFQVLLDRIGKNPASPVMPALTAALCDMVKWLEPRQIQHLYEALRQEANPAMLPHAVALCFFLAEVCDGNQDRFNQAVQDPKGYEQLKSYVERATAAGNEAVLMRVCEFATPFVEPAHGLRARYYLGPFDELVLERVDPSVVIPYRQFPVPNTQQRDVSARWTGTLLVAQRGDYVFNLNAQGRTGLWIDDNPIAFPDRDWRSKTSTVALASGPHNIRVDLQNRGENIRAELQWSGPGISRQVVIPASVLRTPMWRDELAKLPAVIRSLASTNTAEVAAARATLLQAGGAGNIFLQHAVRTQPEPVAKAAAALLKNLQNPVTVEAPPPVESKVKPQPQPKPQRGKPK